MALTPVETAATVMESLTTETEVRITAPNTAAAPTMAAIMTMTAMAQIMIDVKIFPSCPVFGNLFP